METEPSKQNWHLRARQWAWLAVSFVTAALGVVVLVQRHHQLTLDAQYASAGLELNRENRDNDLAVKKLDEYQILLDDYATQKEKIVAEIAQFKSELETLQRRTKNIERVRDQLTTLDSAAEEFYAAEKSFDADLAKLETKVKGKTR
jgi:hypothetical protein